MCLKRVINDSSFLKIVGGLLATKKKKPYSSKDPKISQQAHVPNISYYCYIVYHFKTKKDNCQNIHLNFSRSPVSDF